MTIPEQFRDPATGGLNAEALLSAYLDLEQRMPRVPDSPDGYDVKFSDARFSADPAVNKRLHAAGLTPAQVQLVYDLAAEHLGPAVERMGAEFEARRQGERLVERFGGQEKFGEIARQLRLWGKANLPEDVLHALSCTEEGVCAMHAMMQKGEPGFGASSGGATGPSDEAGLTQMMRDPRYWKNRDPDYIARVSEGFRRLYPG